MPYLHSNSRWLSIIAAVVLLGGIAFAQTAGDAEIYGTVKDPSGSSIPGAALSLTNQDTGVMRASKSDADGHYRFAAVLPGRYSLKVEAVGFATATIADIVLNIGASVDHDIALTVGAVQESVMVTGELPPIDVSKSDVSGIVTN
jgi:Carboxypeptidase regulatory-like domain